jgi:sialic acid synthase SpsE
MVPPVEIVAEAAQGFEGSPALARLLVGAAATGGADTIKFQLVYADELATPAYAYYALFKQLEMESTEWAAVVKDADDSGLRVAFDVFGPRSLDLALELGAAAVKIHASDFFNTALVGPALARAPRLFLSAGGITTDEIGEFLSSAASRAEAVTLMYGFQAEPTPTADNHLSRLRSLRERFPALKLGFMDHSDGDSDESGWLGALALPFGITVIEKHITIDRALKLEDYGSALASPEFRRFVDRIRAAEAALGSSSLELTVSELAYRRRAVKVLVAGRTLPEGSAIGAGDLQALRTPTDDTRRPLHRAADAIGRRLGRQIAAGEPVYREDLA